MGREESVGRMKERPIIFSSEMVLTILNNTKTQTRRVIKLQPLKFSNMHPVGQSEVFREFMKKHLCPYEVGMRLWVRETWAYIFNSGSEPPTYTTYFKANGNTLPGINKWRPSIFMPRWASRITLEIVNIRVERVQDISEEDAKAEGTKGLYDDWAGPGKLTYRKPYKALWDSINSKRGYGWDVNPWVWVIEFKVLQ
jgi:hypothetical protein